MYLYTFLLFSVSFVAGMESDIIGGKESKPHSRPYLASLQLDRHHTCGGMLIKDNYVLTSAHCANTGNYHNHLEVVLGAHNISKNEKSQQRIPVKQFIRHPLFEKNNKRDYSYDIMLLKLKTKARLNKFVKVMDLPKKNGKTPALVNCSIAGWGMKNKSIKKASDVLLDVTLKLQFSNECLHKWKDWFNSERNMCSVSNGNQAFCMGDSGSPLFCNTKPVAIATYTINENCTSKKYPQVYLKISCFLSWIKKNIG